MTEFDEMPVTSPGPTRHLFRFAEAVEREFEFLASLGLKLVSAESTFARFEAEDRFVNVFHGRASYEIGVEVGRWIEIDGVPVEQKFSLAYLEQVLVPHGERSVRGLTAVDADQVSRFVSKFAEWSR